MQSNSSLGSIAVRRCAAGVLIALMCCSFASFNTDGQNTFSLFEHEDDRTSLDHVRNLLSTLDVGIWNPALQPNRYVQSVQSVHVGQPFLLSGQTPWQTNVEMPETEFPTDQPETPPAAVLPVQSDDLPAIDGKPAMGSAFVFMPSEAQLQGSSTPPQYGEIPPSPNTNFVYPAPPLKRVAAFLPPFPASSLPPRPILERHDLEQWLRLRQMAIAASIDTNALKAPSKSEISAQQALVASERASKAAAMAALGIKAGAIAYAAASAAMDAVTSGNATVPAG